MIWLIVVGILVFFGLCMLIQLRADTSRATPPKTWGLAYYREDLSPDFRLFIPGDGNGGVNWKDAKLTGLDFCRPDKPDYPCGGRWEPEKRPAR